MEVKYPKKGGTDRHVKVQGRLSDQSGHTLIMDMLVDLKDWTQQRLITTAFSIMAEQWQIERDAGREFIPLQPSQAVVTKEMRDLHKQSQGILQETRNLLQLLLNGNFVNSGSPAMNAMAQGELGEIIAKIDVITTASEAFGGDLVENTEEIREDW